MSAENSPEEQIRQIRDLTFIIPNETPLQEVISIMERIANSVYEGAIIDPNKISDFGTIWIAEVSMIKDKPRKEVEEMTEEELELELFRRQYLQDEF